MFPDRPRRPMVPYQQQGPQWGPHTRQSSLKSNLLSHFQTSDGQLDFEKISVTAQQVRELYGQVSPMVKQVSPVVKKWMKK